MKRARLAGAAAILAASLLVPAARAEDKYILDEYNFDLYGAPDSSRIAAGLNFGTAYGEGVWWSAGPRVSWVRWNVDMPKETGYGVGGVFSLGWRPSKFVSPVGGIAVDRVFSVNDAFEWQALVHAGVRVKVTPDPREHFTMTFAVYNASVFGGSGPGGNDFGIAVLYSAALFARHR
ncbi:MAG TPA: hypothetical protein VFB67_09210 [Candidatus Polarisedimenticolaceae bacterium]|nr:hypothetical protein [Candidatus Polarisedimenticolaceae bacterium]